MPLAEDRSMLNYLFYYKDDDSIYFYRVPLPKGSVSLCFVIKQLKLP